MSRFIALILGICVFSAHSAVHRTKDASLNRIARSPHYGSSYHHEDIDQPPPPPHGPPPSPIVYHTQNWSGVAKGLDGTPQGVFSGAAASAQSAAPAISEAFSLATSGTGPVTSGEQVKIKSRFGSHSYDSGSGSHSSGSIENKKHAGPSNDFGSSEEGQYNIKLSGLDIAGGASGSGSVESESQLDKKADAAGFDKVSAGGISAGLGGSSAEFKSVDFNRESGQRSINSGFGGKPFGGGYGSQSSQYGSAKTFSDTENRGDIGSESLTDGNSAGRASADFKSQSEQHNLQTSNSGLARFNGQSGQFNAGLGFGDKTVNRATDSNNQFGQKNGQSSGSGYQRGGTSRGSESHSGGGYGIRREFENHGGYGVSYPVHHGDIHRHGKSNDESNHLELNGKQFGNQGRAGQGFGDNGQIHSTGFSGSNYNGQSSGSGYQRGGASGGFESQGGAYGVRREFENHSGYGGGNPGHNGDIHRHGKSHDESHHFEQNGKQFGKQGSVGQGFDDNGQIRSKGFSDSQSSSFGSNRGNYGSGSSGFGAGYSGNLGQAGQSGKFDTDLTLNRGGPQDFSGGQQVQQSGQLNAGFSASQAGSQGLSGGESQSSFGASRHGYKKSGSSNGESKGTLVAGNANGGISSTHEAEGSLSSNADASGHEDIQSTLGSALNLASQGLQAAQRAPCATCDKGSYALSNAKSHSGSAIALSIGG
ncbi:glycine-rich cell wall structural protein 1.8-like isoform X2 [Maniola jurtina]|uniref:glycine-rich cell wall structural protein 1.8-like isoform X2 n=1 Tax=Maniola jurtina TaxID=191418 RepID=UPI001E687020|nr:glycine-rich cell wall structural protein 1.8-like isoform X2 [Maniola jurtina]